MLQLRVKEVGDYNQPEAIMTAARAVRFPPYTSILQKLSEQSVKNASVQFALMLLFHAVSIVIVS